MDGEQPQSSSPSSTYVAPDGSIKALVPRNVNINQFYPQVAFSSPKDRPVVKLGEFVDISPPPGLAITDGKEEAENEADGVERGEQKGEERKENEETKTEAKSLDEQAVPSTAGDDDAVFSTQVDEDTIEAAKQRQKSGAAGGAGAGGGGGNLFEPENWEVTRQTTTMRELMEEKINKHFDVGDLLHSRGDYLGAITHYNKAISLQPRNPHYYVQRAEAFLQLADFQSSILNYKRACVLSPDNFTYYSRLAFIYYFHGQCLFDQKLFPEALEAFSRAAEMRPEVIGYHTRSIACLAALQRHGECLALVNKRLEMEQENADLYIMRARLHQLFRNTTLCYYDVKDALSLSPHHPEAVRLMQELEHKAMELRQQAMHLNLMGRHRDAMQKVALAIETNPSVADFHVLRGALHRRLGDFNAAIDDYLLALDKTDHDEEHPVYRESQRQLLLTYNDFAIECFTKGFFEEAIILLNKAIKGEKDERGLYINRGDCFYKQNELQFALADYHQALEMDPSDLSIKCRIAVIHNDYGLQEYNDKNYKEAEGRFTLSIQHNPHKAEYYISRARVRQLMENIGSARQDLLLALHLEPSHPEILSVLTRLFPGKSVKEVLGSPAAAKARLALQNMVTTASPVRLKPVGSGSEFTESAPSSPSTELCPSTAAVVRPHSGPAGSSYLADPEEELPPVAGAAWKPGECVPDIRACMREKEFHVKVAKEKQVINKRVKAALNERKPLGSHLEGVRVNSLPTPPPSGKPKSKMAVPTGWRKFSQGVGVAK